MQINLGDLILVDTKIFSLQNIYRGHYNWHNDAIKKMGLKNINRKLSMSVQLSKPEDYEGGDLRFNLRGLDSQTDDNIMSPSEFKQQGSIIVFPSFLWHKVEPITKIRYSLSNVGIRRKLEMSLHEKKYIVIRKILSKELTKVYYDYMINKEKDMFTLLDNRFINPFSTDYGIFNDPQVPNAYSLYGDILFDNMMIDLKPRIEKETDS